MKNNIEPPVQQSPDAVQSTFNKDDLKGLVQLFEVLLRIKRRIHKESKNVRNN